MTVWEQLGIEKTKDKRKIKRAYAKQAAKYHPEEHPEEFRELYEAYQSALSYAARSAFDEDTDAFILEELINATSSPQPPEWEEEESTVDFSAFDKNTYATILEELINEKSSPQPPEWEEEESTVNFSTFDIDKTTSAEELAQRRLIDGILHNMQTIIEKPEKNIVWKIAKAFLGRLFDRQLEEWKNLLASSGFQKVRNEQDFIIKLNKLECVSSLSRDMAVCLYRGLDFEFIEKSFERTDYQELQFRIQQCIDGDVQKKQKADRRESCLYFGCLIIWVVIYSVGSAGIRRFEALSSKLGKRRFMKYIQYYRENIIRNLK